MTNKTQPTAHAEITAPISADLRGMDDAGAHSAPVLQAEALAEVSKEQYARMFGAACEALGQISDHLGIDSDINPGAEPIIEAIDELRAAAMQAAPPAPAALVVPARVPDLSLEAIGFISGPGRVFLSRVPPNFDEWPVGTEIWVRPPPPHAPAAPAVDAPAAVAVPDERVAFEAWGRSVHLGLERVGDRPYYWQYARWAWDAWQARATLPDAPAQEHATQLAGQGLEQWRPMETAPKDGTLLRLLVEFEDHATEDGEGPQPTIGANTWDNHHDFDEWQFAGWNWEQDCYTQGVGKPVGWLPMLADAPVQVQFQQRVQPWLLACFGAEIAADKQERNHRFLEESVELVQANGCTLSEAHQLVDYVYGRPVGEMTQEVGGVMAALCLASGVDMHQAGETELARIWGKVEQIRAKQAAKPKHSPLPAAPAQAQKDACPILDDEWKRRMLDGHALVRDDMGCGYHPALPTLDEGMNPKQFFAALGIELAGGMAEDQMDMDAYDAMVEATDYNVWTPEAPAGHGWVLVAIFDTEDGPAAWWIRAAEPKQPARRGRKSARDAAPPSWWPEFIQSVAELPDRSSPEDEPDAMVATADELGTCAINAIDAARAAQGGA